MRCAHCQEEFTPKPWPATRAKFCSIPCNKAAWYERNKGAVNAAAKQWCRDNPEKRRQVQKNWNNSEGGKALKHAWFKENYPRLYARWKKTGYTKRISAHTQSRRVLLRHRPDKRCVCRGVHEGRIECHHRDGNPFNWTLSNLEWRCLRHHRGWHRALKLQKRRAAAALDS